MGLIFSTKKDRLFLKEEEDRLREKIARALHKEMDRLAGESSAWSKISAVERAEYYALADAVLAAQREEGNE
jgi:cell division protein FtsL